MYSGIDTTQDESHTCLSLLDIDNPSSSGGCVDAPTRIYMTLYNYYILTVHTSIRRADAASHAKPFLGKLRHLALLGDGTNS